MFSICIRDSVLKSVLAYGHTLVQMFNIFKHIIVFELLEVAPVNCY